VPFEQTGLCLAEISRLYKIILGVKVYQQLFIEFHQAVP
jgi:hypothetical protein